MYPRQFIDSYWSPNLKNQAFVAMSFRDDSIKVYEKAIKPACFEHFKNEPICVNYNKGGDSIVNEILDGITHCRLFIGEISTMREKDYTSRNGNVMWEVGVAHAFRQHEEVILLRSDREKLLFDIGQIRVHLYDRSDLESAKKTISEIIEDRLKLIDDKKSMLVDLALWALNPGALSALLNVSLDEDRPSFFIMPNLLNQQIWPKLFELGIVELAPDAINQETINKARTGDTSAFCMYRVTHFGMSVLGRLWKQIQSNA